MSEPKRISPMLDNFLMGDPISEHHGIRCCPAMEKETDNKYIVKILSVPASQTQLDALLLSGAYQDSEAALSYFQQLTDGITDEVSVLNELAELEGYLPIESTQVVPMDDGVGFDVYLLSAYRNTLERKLRRDSMTHLSALNLGLDLCAALAVARRMGYIYVDLKPGNIYLNGDQGYRIGDIGFLKLNSLRYASLPDRYRSAYTAPEITDAYSALNTTIDVYALGLILYQVFNDGNLPFKGDVAPAEEFPAPDYADYEMSEIILKACSPDPNVRWQDPIAFGQALIDYMQRNGAHDTPIVPTVTEEESVDEEIPEDAEDPDTQETLITEDSVADAECVAETAESTDVEDPAEITEESIYTEDSDGNLTFIEGETDETMDAQDAEEIDYEEVTEEVSDMLQQADELIAHDAPDPVVAPEPIDVPIPPLETPVEEIQNEETAATEEDGCETEDMPECLDDNCVEEESASAEDASEADAEPSEDTAVQAEDTVEKPADDTAVEELDTAAETDSSTPKRKRGWIGKTILIILSLACLVAGFFFYRTYYLQTIDAITLEAGSPHELTVMVLTEADEEKLTVVCTDTYGNQHTAPVVDGAATFSQLTPNSAYAIKVTISGFHHLTGKTTAAYTTPNQTEIAQFTAVTGAEEGSVILCFSINGPDSDRWSITYLNDSGTEETISFAGHMVTFSGLTTGNEYHFTLTPEDDLLITGTDKIAYVAKSIVKPENLLVSSCVDNSLTAKWSVRPDADVSGWTVRCYNDNFDETIVVTDTTAQFNIPDASASYTVEVTASGMSVSERTFVSENSLNVKDFTITDAKGKLLVSWNPVSGTPDGGWILSYTVGGSAPIQVSVGDECRTEIAPVVPDCQYHFVLQTTDGIAVLGGTQDYTTATPAAFSGYSVSADNMEFMMCLTPSYSNWDRYDLSQSDYTTTFALGKKASFLVRLNHAYDTSGDIIDTLFVIRDEQGAVVSTDLSSRTWSQMWWRNYCELDIPSLPQTPGDYTVSVYFNGQFANQTAFTVTE